MLWTSYFIGSLQIFQWWSETRRLLLLCVCNFEIGDTRTESNAFRLNITLQSTETFTCGIYICLFQMRHTWTCATQSHIMWVNVKHRFSLLQLSPLLGWVLTLSVERCNTFGEKLHIKLIINYFYFFLKMDICMWLYFCLVTTGFFHSCKFLPLGCSLYAGPEVTMHTSVGLKSASVPCAHCKYVHHQRYHSNLSHWV